MRSKPYYSMRTGKNPTPARFDLPAARDMFQKLFLYFEDEGYFQEALGYECVDEGFVPGSLGADLQGTVLLELRKENLTPIRDRIFEYSEEDLFDMVEFLYDHCSKPTQRHFHNFNNCGWHCQAFDSDVGREEFRQKTNRVLALYEDGFELDNEGEILALAEQGLEELFDSPLPTSDPDNIGARVDAAIRKFRRYRSSVEDRRDAIRDLADALEYLRPQLKQVLYRRDEADLFDIANNFGIRHHEPKQKTKYDKSIWYDWMFYYYLATIHASVRLVERKEAQTDPA